MALATALHSSLAHECLHGHPTRNARVNEALVGVPLTVLHPFRRYKALHLAHHRDERLTDPLGDPESYYLHAGQFETLAAPLRWLLTLNNTLLGRMVLGPPIALAGFLGGELRLLRAGAPGVRRAWLLHAVGLIPLLAALAVFGLPLWLYLLAVVWPALALISIRTFAEHRWHDAPEGRTIIVERSPLGWLFLHNNLHIVHHTRPSAPWYALPGIYAQQRGDWQAMNDGYVYRGYGALFARYAVRPKEPVIHPAPHAFTESARPARASGPGA